MKTVIETMTQAIDREVLEASSSAINARQADTVYGKLGELSILQDRLQRALNMVQGVRALAASANATEIAQ